MKKLTILTALIFCIPLFAQSKYSNMLLEVPSRKMGWGAETRNIDGLPTGYGNHLMGLHNLTEVHGNTKMYSPGDNLTTRQLEGANLFEKCVSSVVFVVAGSGFGGGVIIDDEVVTNFHVVEGLNVVGIVTYSSQYTTLTQMVDKGSLIEADVIAVDVKRDLALIKPRKSLPKNTKSAKLGKNYKIKVANEVFAIGHPKGLIWSYTYGVISGLPTPFEWSYDPYLNFSVNCIQTQTPINPGNSGGPLFNNKGKVVGINSMGKKAQGLNFAIRIDEIKDFLKKARKGEYPKGTINEWTVIKDHGFKDVSAVFGKDMNHDGYIDIWGIYKDNDEKVDAIYHDINGDGNIDAILDMETGIWLIDKDYDGKTDVVGTDTNGDYWPDEFAPYEG